MTRQHCTACDKVYPTELAEQTRREWWNLQNYFGFYGFFCPNCFDAVDHWDDKPRNPEACIAMRFKLNQWPNKKACAF
jgi:hypothetical protein